MRSCVKIRRCALLLRGEGEIMCAEGEGVLDRSSKLGSGRGAFADRKEEEGGKGDRRQSR